MAPPPHTGRTVGQAVAAAMTAAHTAQVEVVTTSTGLTAGTEHVTVDNGKTTVTRTGQHRVSETMDTLAGAVRIGTAASRAAKLRETARVCPQGVQINLLGPQSQCPRRSYQMLVTGGTVYTPYELGLMSGTSRRPWLALRLASPRSLAHSNNLGRALSSGLADAGFLLTDLQLQAANPGFIAALVSAAAPSGGAQARGYSGTVALASLSRALAGDPVAKVLPLLGGRTGKVHWTLRLGPGRRPTQLSLAFLLSQAQPGGYLIRVSYLRWGVPLTVQPPPPSQVISW